MVIKRTIGEKIFDSANVVFLTVFSLVTLYPFLYVIFASVSVSDELMKHVGALFMPLGFSWAAYKATLANPMILSGYANTIFVVVVGTLYNIIMTSMGAYILSRKNFFWKKTIIAMVLVTMYFGGGLIPKYLLIQNLGMTNTLWALIIPEAISTWNLFIMRTFFMGIPDSLEESAKLDGANDFTVLLKVILPLSMPVIAVMLLYYGVAHWNTWFDAMIYIRKRSLYPLQLVLREILIINSTDSMMSDAGIAERSSVSETIKYATIMVATLPILFAYPWLQKYFVKGVMIGALKG